MERDVAMLLVEQNAVAALRIADYAFVVENGRIVLMAMPRRAVHERKRTGILSRLHEVGRRKSYRDAKHYRRRKRSLS